MTQDDQLLDLAAGWLRGRPQGRDRHGRLDLGLLTAPGGQPPRGRRRRQHGRLGLGRLHRGGGDPRGHGDHGGAPPKLLDFGVTDERAWDVGLACGGKVEVYVEAVR